MRRASGVALTSTVAALVTLAMVTSGSAGAGVQGLRLGVPAYWSPATAWGADDFRRLADAAGTVDIVIINGPASAAPVPFDPQTARTIRTLRRAGVTVLGYVDSGYLGRTGMTTTRVRPGSTDVADWVSQVRADVADWYELYGWYGLGGVFVDQTLSTCGDDQAYVNAYREALYDVRRGNRGAMVVINPGVAPDECYVHISDAIITFENTYEVYRGWSQPSWASRYPADQFWHLVYDAPTLEAMHDAVHLARQRHAGLVYVTDHPWSSMRSQWDSLPTYWNKELCLVAQETATCH
jgi:hypothetical protein